MKIAIIPKLTITWLLTQYLKLSLSIEKYDSFSDEDESDYYKSTPKHAIIAITHLKEMAEECTDKTCIWEITKE